jgi:ADP-heptose:LPS heptosyltransferase
VENFARLAEFVENKGLTPVAIAAKTESETLDALRQAAKATAFVGNDSGIAHIAAAVGIPTVVIFGSSNRTHWRPWTDAPNEIVFTEFRCQPCAGYECTEFGTPRCILEVPPSAVFTALERVLSAPKV